MFNHFDISTCSSRFTLPRIQVLSRRFWNAGLHVDFTTIVSRTKIRPNPLFTASTIKAQTSTHIVVQSARKCVVTDMHENRLLGPKCLYFKCLAQCTLGTITFIILNVRTNIVYENQLSFALIL